MKGLCSRLTLIKGLAGFFAVFSVGFLFSGSVCAHSVPLEYDMTVDFEVEKSALSGEADFNLPAGHGMKLLVSGLEDLRVKVGGSRLEKDPDKEGIMAIPTEDNKRRVSLSWKKKAGKGGTSLISPEGITLQGTWYPRPASEAVYSLKALVPSGFAAVSEANRIETEQKGEQKQVTFHFPHPLSNLHLIAAPYEVVEEEFSDGKVLASYFFEEDKDLASSYRKKTRNYLKRYIGLFGEYPYGRFSIVENRRPTGFAMPTFTLLGRQVVRLPFILDTSLGHEVLHSWLGNAVQAAPGQGNWVEGLATYLADQAYAADKGEGADFRKSQLVKYQNHVDGNNTLTVKGFTNPGGHDVADQAKRAVGYNKCSMIFHMLRNRVGEDDFRKFLRRFYEDNKYGRAGWQEIEEIFSGVSGMDLSAFFDQWLNRSDVPVLEIRNPDFREAGGDLLLSFEIAQKNSKPYNLYVPVRVHTESGTVNKTVELESGRVSVSLELPDYPTRLTVDPEYDLMRSLAEEELPPVWSAFLGAGDKLAVIEEGKEELYAPMAEMVEKLGGRVVKEENLDDKEMGDSSLLFLGEDSRACRSIFGEVDPADQGFSLEVRKNPLNLKEVAVINQASDRREVEAVAGKLRHYGKYGILHFQEGRNLKKEIPGSSRGIVRNLDKTPGGIALSERRDFGDIMEKMAENRVIYVGESHVRFADHQLQLRIIRALHQRHPEMAIGMEMFPARVQETLDKYIRGEIDERRFLKEAEYFQNWGYDYRFYQDIMQFAGKHNIPVLGLNLDREIVNTTFHQGGIAALGEEVKKDLPESRDLSMEGYRERLGDVFKQHKGPHFNNGMMSGFVQAQALWDETMAEKVADYLRENSGSKMVVLAGRGHVNKKTGIPPRVSRRLEVPQSVAVNSGGEEKLSGDSADYLFFTPPIDMEKSPMLGVKLNSGEEGLTVAGFTHGRSPAREAGLQEGDVILAFEGREVNNVEDIKIVLLYREKGDTVKVKVRRDSFFLFPDSEREIEVRL